MILLDNILNPFKDTIFLKEDSNLEKQLEELKELNVNDATIDKEIKLLEYGINGENIINILLKKL